MRPVLPPDYRPSDDEEFMNPLQVEYFRQKLLRWRAELLADSTGTLRHLQEESLLKPDLTDRASLETERAIELRTRDRERKLISKIDAALAAHRQRHLWLLRGNRSADRHPPAGGASDRDADDRSAGAARADGAHLPRRVASSAGTPPAPVQSGLEVKLSLTRRLAILVRAADRREPAVGRAGLRRKRNESGASHMAAADIENAPGQMPWWPIPRGARGRDRWAAYPGRAGMGRASRQCRADPVRGGCRRRAVIYPRHRRRQRRRRRRSSSSPSRWCSAPLSAVARWMLRGARRPRRHPEPGARRFARPAADPGRRTAGSPTPTRPSTNLFPQARERPMPAIAAALADPECERRFRAAAQPRRARGPRHRRAAAALFARLRRRLVQRSRSTRSPDGPATASGISRTSPPATKWRR